MIEFWRLEGDFSDESSAFDGVSNLNFLPFQTGGLKNSGDSADKLLIGLDGLTGIATFVKKFETF